MKIFKNRHKINFIDENNVLVGFDEEQQCCENVGWFLCDHIVSDINQPCVSIDENKDFSGWVFNIKFCKDFASQSQDDEGGIVVFELTKRNKVIYLHLYNFHNGYYSHGFSMNQLSNVLHQDSL